MKSSATTTSTLLSAVSTAAALLLLSSSSSPTAMAFTTTTTTAITSTSRTTFASASASRTTTTTTIHATATAAELNQMTKEEQIHRLGIDNEEEQLACGIDVDEVLEFIGTREDLITKFQTDIPSFSLTQATEAADSFLMDGEMLDLYIKYSQRKAEDPNWEPVYAEEDNSPVAQVVNFVSQYAIYIVGGILVKDVVTGFMEKNGISIGGFGAGAGGDAEVLVSSTMDAVHHHLTNTLV